MGALLAIATAACAKGSGATGATSSPDRVPMTEVAPAPIIAGATANGPILRLEALSAAAWDGRLLWLADVEGRLLAVDGKTKKIVSDRRLDSVIADTSNLISAPPGELWGFAKNNENNAVEVLRVDVNSGQVASAVTRGRPLGQSFLQDRSLYVADYELGVVVVDPITGTSSVTAVPGVAPNLLQPSSNKTFWVVDDSRQLLLRVDETGHRLVALRRERFVKSIAADTDGNLWLAEGAAVVVVAPNGSVISEIGGFSNAASVLQCGTSIVVSDVDSGDIVWFDGIEKRRPIATNVAGRAVTCADEGVWFLSADGYLARIFRQR